MIKSLNVVVKKHLQSLELKPELVKNLTKKASLWSFEIAPEIEAECLCRVNEKNDIAITIMVTMDVVAEEALVNAYVMALAQVSIPIVFTATKKAVSVRLQIRSDLKNLNALISEAIVLCRHHVGALFLGVIELEEQPLYETIEQTLERLQHTEII